MEQICKNCKHFNPVTSVCDWYDLIKLENHWCYAFLPKEKEKKMDFDFETLTEDEIKDFMKMAQAELNKRERQRRETLRNAFISAWRKLEDDGATIYLRGEYSQQISLEDLEIE